MAVIKMQLRRHSTVKEKVSKVHAYPWSIIRQVAEA